ncbi:histidine kinase [Paenibacillus sp. N4]|uniref:sensor histidine kinase n=1 Tax=Paenibacillus vietnamensis TaxID=2590547 RepID=UPI001CD17B8F|nr:histidine kinase [Paenibacillus vietnamensis]MCA0753483.1 histidine kinase [Paenibacillus vietnamensis]
MLKIPAISLRNTIFVRLVATYLFVVLPIILLGVYLYNWSYKNASQDISRATVKQLTYYLDGLNREVDWMELQQYDLLKDSELNRLAAMWGTMDNADKRSSLNGLLHRLTSFQNSSPYIKDIYVHIRPIGKTVSASKAVYDFDWGRYNYFLANADKKESRLNNWNNTLHLSASKQSGKKGEKPLVLVQIELDTERLKESLHQINIYPESGSFLISETTGFALMSHEESDSAIRNYVEEMITASEHTSLLKMDGKTYHIDKTSSDKLGLSVATYLPEETVKRPLTIFYRWAWVFALTSLFAVVIFSYSSYTIIHKPLLFLVQSFKRMEGGALNIQIEHEQKDEFGYLYTRFNHMLTKLQSLIDQDFKQKMMMQKAELKQLQSQINPHFLYNSFFILNSLAKTGDIDRIEQFTNMLGEYFRFITRNGEDHVSLSEEVRHSRMYTEIQKLRFSRRIRVQFDELPKEMETIKVPRLILQPIIENAYEHSLEKMTEEGLLRVSFEMERAETRIIVEDNGDSISDSDMDRLRDKLLRTDEAYEMTGIINIHRRLVLTFGEGSGLFLSRSELNGLKAEIRIRREESQNV